MNRISWISCVFGAALLFVSLPQETNGQGRSLFHFFQKFIFRRIVEIEIPRVEISCWRKRETRRCLNFGSEETRNAPDERDGKIMKERKTDAA